MTEGISIRVRGGAAWDGPAPDPPAPPAWAIMRPRGAVSGLKAPFGATGPIPGPTATGGRCGPYRASLPPTRLLPGLCGGSGWVALFGSRGRAACLKAGLPLPSSLGQTHPYNTAIATQNARVIQCRSSRALSHITNRPAVPHPTASQKDLSPAKPSTLGVKRTECLHRRRLIDVPEPGLLQCCAQPAERYCSPLVTSPP